jgi:hypothetical protein
VITRWLRRARPIAIASVGLLFAVLLVMVMLGSGNQAKGETPTISATASPASAAPSPAWMDQLAADYADACGEALDPATIAGLTQVEAEDEVGSLIDECNRPGKGKGRGNGGR